MGAVVSFHEVSKSFKRGENLDSLRDLMPALVARFWPGSPLQRKKREPFWALKDLTFEVKPGRTLGIIGPNGSGKTTTLKLISGILRPTRGEIKRQGRLGALIEVGAGFHGDLTGRENTYLNGSIMGMKISEIKRRFDEIIAFAEVEDFVDTPVKRYSSGMHVRLGFSIAAHLEPDVLVVDEALAVGDARFQAKCTRKSFELKKAGTTMIVVSHHMGIIDSLCDEVLLLERGQRIKEGSPSEVIAYYQQRVLSLGEEGPSSLSGSSTASEQDAEILFVHAQPAAVTASQEIQIRCEIMNRAPSPTPYTLHLTIHSEAGVPIHHSSTLMDDVELILNPGRTTVVFRTDAALFLEGNYYVSMALNDDKDGACFDFKRWCAMFRVANRRRDLAGLFSIPRKWELVPVDDRESAHRTV